MAAIRGRRRTPLIWALETYELHGRPTCSECTDRLKIKRGCPLDDSKAKGKAFRFESPYLGKESKLVYQCPVGLILRDSPWVYSMIDVANMSEHSPISDWNKFSLFAQTGVRLVNSERERLREAKRRNSSVFNDSSTGMRARNG